jgi:hypothetical protein
MKDSIEFLDEARGGDGGKFEEEPIGYRNATNHSSQVSECRTAQAG